MSTDHKNMMVEFKRLLRESDNDFTDAIAFLVLHDVDSLARLPNEDFVFIKTVLEKIKKKKISPEILRQAFYKVGLIEKKFGPKKSTVQDFMPEHEDWSELLSLAKEKEASAVFLKVDRAPIFRIGGILRELTDLPVYNKARLLKLISNTFSPQQYSDLMEQKRAAFSLSLPGVSRFRVSAYFENSAPALSFRQIPLQNPELPVVGLTAGVIDQAVSANGGLILITGMAQSGKSTACAAIVNHINQNNAFRMITIENPIEFLFRDQKSAITQLELGTDISTPHMALQNAIKTANFIFISHLDTANLMEKALDAAESGCLVLLVLPATNCVKALEYLAGFFTGSEQHFFMERVSMAVRLVTAQIICQTNNQSKQVIREIFTPDANMRNLIKERTFPALQNLFDETQSLNNCSFLRSFATAIEAGMVSYHDIQHQIPDLEKFVNKYKHIAGGV